MSICLSDTHTHTQRTHTHERSENAVNWKKCANFVHARVLKHMHTHTHTCSVSEALTRIGVFNMHVRASHYDDNENRSRTHTRSRSMPLSCKRRRCALSNIFSRVLCAQVFLCVSVCEFVCARVYKSHHAMRIMSAIYLVCFFLSPTRHAIRLELYNTFTSKIFIALLLFMLLLRKSVSRICPHTRCNGAHIRRY